MKTLLALIIGLTSLSSYAAVTKNMISFDIFKAYTGLNSTFTNREFDDDDLGDDEEETYFSIAAVYGRRIHSNLQVLGLLDYSFSDDEGNEWSKSFEYGVGLEYNFSENFANSLYVSFLVSREEEQDKYSDELDTDVQDRWYLSIGKRFPIVGKEAFLTYSPDITVSYVGADEDEDFYEGTTRIAFNFLKLDLLF